MERDFFFPSIISLAAGSTYFAAIHSFVDYEYGISGTNLTAQSRISFPNMANSNPNSSFNLSSIPMIRLNFDLLDAINNESKTFNSSISPNPSKGKFIITFDNKKTENIIYTIKNLVGQTIINETISVYRKTNHSISLANYSKGVYFLTIDNETVKLILE